MLKWTKGQEGELTLSSNERPKVCWYNALQLQRAETPPQQLKVPERRVQTAPPQIPQITHTLQQNLCIPGGRV